MRTRRIFALTISMMMVISFLVMPISFAEVVTGDTYYVAVDGSDSNDGSSENPWRTILHASQQLTAGNTLIVRGGTYVDDSVRVIGAGTAEAPITIKAGDDEIPVLTGTGKPEGIIHFNVNNKYIIIDGINLKDTLYISPIRVYNAPVTVNDSSNIVFRNCTFTNNIGETGTFMTFTLASFLTVEYCSFNTTGGELKAPGSGSGDGIYVNSCTSTVIENNHFVKCGHYATDFKDNNDGGATTSYNNVIRGNLIEQYWGGGIGLIFGAYNNLIENNIIYYAGAECEYPKTGIQLAADGNIIRNNIIGWTSDGSRGGYSATAMSMLSYPLREVYQNCNDNRIYNNVFYKSGGRPIFINQKNETTVDRNKV